MVPISSTTFWKGSRLLKTVLFATVLILSQIRLQAQTTSCTANAGSLTAIDLCVLTNQKVLKARAKGDAVLPTGFQRTYLLTRGSQLVIIQVSNEPIFSLPDSATGLYTIHTLIHNSNTLSLNSVNFGQTTGFDLNNRLIQGGGTVCGALDVTGVKARFGSCDDVRVAAAGTLAASTDGCFSNGRATLLARVQISAIIPDGYTRLYVLTSGDSLVIEEVSATASFTVSRIGEFKIHTLVYDSTTFNLDTIRLGTTRAAQVSALLQQGGGSICGALDMTGTRFRVLECLPMCAISSGVLEAMEDSCLTGGSVLLIAKTVKTPVAPQGYQVRYLLSSNSKIQQFSNAPSFVIRDSGVYVIHTLVYDPATYNPSTIEFGTFTITQLNSLFQQGGGTICAAVDVTGAKFEVSPCEKACTAHPGTIRPDNAPCFENGQATLKAKLVTQPIVPQGYEVRYLLTYNNSATIISVGETPFFKVNQINIYGIHTLVYEPTTLNINTDVAPGNTTLYDLDELFKPNGGSLCGAVDLVGARFNVAKCGNSCPAYAGKLFAVSNTVCLRSNAATLRALVQQYPVTPTGYEVVYLLSYGATSVIEQRSTQPIFNVTRNGDYAIHTLIYKPSTFSLSIIGLGQTTIYHLSTRFVPGGGTICGDLEVEGAAVNVSSCSYFGDDDNGNAYLKKQNAYPNPTTNYVNVEFEKTTDEGTITVELFNAAGHVLNTWKFDSETERAALDVRAFTSGLYNLRISYGNQKVENVRVAKMDR